MPNLVNFGKGTAIDEQDLVTHIINFAVGICGWELLLVIQDTASDHEVALKSRGEQPGRFGDLYYTLNGTGNYVHTAMYTRYVDETPDYDGKIYNSDYTRTPCANSNFSWWGFGDADGLWFVWVSGSSYYSMYMGYIEGYCPDPVERVPHICIGQVTDDRWFDSNRCLGYQRADDMSATASGTSRTFISNKNLNTTICAYHDPSTRDGTDQLGIPIIMYRPYTGTEEIRGELKHALCFSGASFSSGDWYTVSGTEYKYFIQKYANDETTGFGPISTSSGTEW